MCNKGIECLEESSSHSCTTTDHEPDSLVFGMDSPTTNSVPPPNYNDENPRVKLLCSFSGNILPRPQDGKLRYVGGETRIVTVPRDTSYEDLMARMRELYEEAAILKYQQPDEDLDALVSVVNDDDVINMMEEYDKLGSADGFTRLRIFLFSHNDQEMSPHYLEIDERDTEKRYVDALNSLNESPDYRRHPLNDSPVMTPVDEFHIADQFFNSMNLDGSLHGHRNYELAMPQYNLRHLAIPNVGSGQHSVPIGQRYNEEAPWSPAYYSPRCAGTPDQRTISEFPPSPSAQLPERVPEEYGRQQANYQQQYDQQPQYSDNVVWLPSGSMPVDKGGFSGNILQRPNVFEGNGVCENCRMVLQRKPSSVDSQWNHDEQPQMESLNVGNGLPPIQVRNPCMECVPNREVLMMKADSQIQHPVFSKEPSDSRSVYAELQNSERGCALQHELHPRAEESRGHISAVGRVNDHYFLDGNGMSIPVGHGNLSNYHHVPPTYGLHDDPRYVPAGPELGSDVFHGQAVAPGSQIHVLPFDERGVLPTNPPYAYGADNSHQVAHGHPPAPAMRRNFPSPLVTSSAVYDPSNLQQRNGIVSPGLQRTAVEGSPRFGIGLDQNPWTDSSQRKIVIDGSSMPESSCSCAGNANAGTFHHESQQSFVHNRNLNALHVPTSCTPLEHVRSSEVVPVVINDEKASSTVRDYSPGPIGTLSSVVGKLEEGGEGSKTVQVMQEVPDMQAGHLPGETCDANARSVVISVPSVISSSLKPVEVCRNSVQQDQHDPPVQSEEKDLDFLPDLVASVQKSKLDSVEVVKSRIQENYGDDKLPKSSIKDGGSDERESVNDNGNSDGGSDNENINPLKIEPTKAEEEALARGLQSIKNDDLEEIRELGSGTYGAVYHGKWKGSDVAIKRIKASCFTGRPSERERLIADFWKEALTLSSLHHPNVVSFYGVVRDGPDGSLATVTEFMINGSLKQYLQKKDRTIDRRKRLIIAMDAAFGMEYLHGKNIVHFDLKCENLLVNMRDPHRPVCKIGDLGLSKVKQHTLVSGGIRGTLPWMAPELLSGKTKMVTEKIDVYSFGIVMWELLTGEEPYKDMHCASIIGGIVNNTLRPQIPTWCDPEWKSLMESCWAPDPAERPSFSEISQRLRSMAAAMNLK